MRTVLALILLLGAIGPALHAQQASAVEEKPSLVLYYSSHCPYSQKVLRYLKNIHKSVHMKDVVDNPQNKEELSRSGGQLLVPCLVIDGKALYDADAIIEWLSKHQDRLEST
jgi:glutaredoxin 3